MSNVDLQGKWALVTGASSGLGVDFAKELARRGANLILAARRVERLQAVQADLRQAFGVQVDVIVMDLGRPDAPQQLYEQVTATGPSLRSGCSNKTVSVLVNNAGFGLYGLSWELPLEREKEMLQLDIVTLVELTRLFLPGMLAQKFGYVLQVASIGAYQPSPTYASYSAAKSFVLSHGEALNYELRNTGVSVTVVSPGVTASEFLQVAGQRASLYQRLVMMQSQDVARIGVEAMLKRKPSVVPGLANALTAFSMRFIPRRLQAAIAYRSMTMG